eukprot:30944-Pelagococcus_subviridis.AAC.4
MLFQLWLVFVALHCDAAAGEGKGTSAIARGRRIDRSNERSIAGFRTHSLLVDLVVVRLKVLIPSRPPGHHAGGLVRNIGRVRAVSGHLGARLSLRVRSRVRANRSRTLSFGCAPGKKTLFSFLSFSGGDEFYDS